MGSTGTSVGFATTRKQTPSDNNSSTPYSDILGNRGQSILERELGVYDDLQDNWVGSMLGRVVNPSRNHTNCSLCTTAGMLQLMGYDVEALPRDTLWRGASTVLDIDWTNYDNYLAPSADISSRPPVVLLGKDPDIMNREDRIRLYDNVDTVSRNPNTVGTTGRQLITNMRNFMQRQGVGAVAEISVSWRGQSSGHSMTVYQSENGTHIIDFQAGRVYTTDEELRNLFSRAVVGRTMIHRIDNVPFQQGVETELNRMVRRRN